ncbi:DsbA family oxidoreductase [Streptomyces lavendulocolor]|uniref:DsbA family oxidoreductase n=1 Tax=Streptomyces TaxID=1883 RepID=UPI003C2BA18B
MRGEAHRHALSWGNLNSPCFSGSKVGANGVCLFAGGAGNGLQMAPVAFRAPLSTFVVSVVRGREEARAMEEHVAANARAEGLAYRTEGRDHGSTFDIHRLLHLAGAHGRQDALLDLAYRANFAEERSVFDPEVLARLGVEAGLAEDEVRRVLADEDACAENVRADEREAAELGATGVPFFVLDRRYGVSGGQPAEVFTRALEQAWEGRAVRRAGAGAGACDADGACPV